MPRVHQRTAHKSKKPRKCDKCGEPIIPGQRFCTWQFRYSGAKYRHGEHGAPRPSDLTQSKLSGLYAARESAEDTLKEWTELSDLADALRECASEAEAVKEEYESAIEAMPEQFQESSPAAEDMREKIEAIESWMEELENAESDIEGMEAEEVDTKEIEQEVAQEMIQEAEDRGKMPDLADEEASANPVEIVRNHLDTEEFERRVKAATEEKEGETNDSMREEAEQKAQEALDALEL